MHTLYTITYTYKCINTQEKTRKQVFLQEVTVEMLTELDRLVQLIESPIFTPLRMEVGTFGLQIKITESPFTLSINQLLDNDQDLISALYGLLMLLPQVIPLCNMYVLHI